MHITVQHNENVTVYNHGSVVFISCSVNFCQILQTYEFKWIPQYIGENKRVVNYTQFYVVVKTFLFLGILKPYARKLNIKNVWMSKLLKLIFLLDIFILIRFFFSMKISFLYVEFVVSVPFLTPIFLKKYKILRKVRDVRLLT